MSGHHRGCQGRHYLEVVRLELLVVLVTQLYLFGVGGVQGVGSVVEERVDVVSGAKREGVGPGRVPSGAGGLRFYRGTHLVALHLGVLVVVGGITRGVALGYEDVSGVDEVVLGDPNVSFSSEVSISRHSCRYQICSCSNSNTLCPSCV
jgi:hypothetical protein